MGHVYLSVAGTTLRKRWHNATSQVSVRDEIVLIEIVHFYIPDWLLQKMYAKYFHSHTKRTMFDDVLLWLEHDLGSNVF